MDRDYSTPLENNETLETDPKIIIQVLIDKTI